MLNLFGYGVNPMAIEQQQVQGEKRIAFVLAGMLCYCIVVVVFFLFIVSIQPFIFLTVLMVGLIAGIVHARSKYLAWQHAVKVNPFRQMTGRYAGIPALCSLLFIVIMSLLANPWKYIFAGIVFGALAGYLLGHFLWFIGLYVNREKTKLVS
jgi:hypothetical protein